MRAPEKIGIPTCGNHLDEPCDGGHGQSRKDCPYCETVVLAPESDCYHCIGLPEYRAPKAPSLDFERASRTLYLAIRGESLYEPHIYCREGAGEPQPLPQRLDLWDGGTFEWGYGGTGPTYLAMCLLAHLTADGIYALSMRHRFKWEVIAKLERYQDWQLTGDQLMEWVKYRPISRDERFRWLSRDEQGMYIDMDLIESNPSECCDGKQVWDRPNRARCTSCGRITDY